MKSFDYTLKDPLGLHMRPAGAMVKRLSAVPCAVTLRCGSRTANAKSILSVMAMAAKCGETVTVEVQGEAEENILREMKTFFEQNF